MLTCVVTQFFIIVLISNQGGCGRERIRGGRARRRSYLGGHRVNYEYKIDNIYDYGKDNFENFERGNTTYASDSANDDMEVLMIPDISNIISAGGNNDDGGGGCWCGSGWWQRQQRFLSVWRSYVDDIYDIGVSGGYINNQEIDDTKLNWCQ